MHDETVEQPQYDAQTRRDQQRYRKGCARINLQAFLAGFLQRIAQTTDISWTYPALQNAFVLQVLRDAVGFAGCEMIRRTVGFAHVYDLDSIVQDDLRAQVLQRVLRQAQTLILSRQQVRRIDDLLTLVSSGMDAAGT